MLALGEPLLDADPVLFPSGNRPTLARGTSRTLIQKRAGRLRPAAKEEVSSDSPMLLAGVEPAEPLGGPPAGLPCDSLNLRAQKR